MLTFFSTPKPFVGHINVIQRNALRSWQQVHPDVEILLFGDDSGAAEVSRELGIRHVPHVRKNRYGTNYVASIYDQAQELARHDLMCYVNCDILMLDDFLRAVERVSSMSEPFLMAGRRWDVEIREPLAFETPAWQDETRKLAIQTNRQRPSQWIDYFVFRRGFFHKQIPNLVVGRPGWDNWMLWYALHSGAKLIDASAVVYAVHQNHDYSHHPEGEKGVWEGEEARENNLLLEGHRKFRTLDNATHLLKPGGLHRNHRAWYVQAKRDAYDRLSPAWYRFLDVTRPVRHLLRLRQKGNSSL
jgi:hypothetical protein